MDEQDLMHRRLESSRPSLGFPLGTALLLIVIFCISGFFSCCYHWDKLRSLRRSAAAASDDSSASPDPLPSSKSPTAYQSSKKNEKESLPVLMPGDEIPKFIAWPCPCQPSPPTRITVEVQIPPLVN